MSRKANTRCNNCEVLIHTKEKHRLFWFCEDCYESIPQEYLRIRIAKKIMTQQIKLERGCEVEGGCDYMELAKAKGEYSSYLLDYDHISKDIKLSNISSMVTQGKYTFDDIVKEISKCRVLCKTHHTFVTVAQWGVAA